MEAFETADAFETVAQVLSNATARLAGAGVPTARLDAEVLLAAACGTDRTGLYVRGRTAVPQRSKEAFERMLARRCSHEPVAYIIARREFWSLDFMVTPDVLIPRPETELLVALAIEALRAEHGGETDNPLPDPSSVRRGTHGVARLCDLGTGSGCIAVALAHELPHAEIWALDASIAALTVAKENAQRHGVSRQVHCIASDLFSALRTVRFDVILCNPPYIASADLPALQPELAWEPRRALDGGVDGLTIIQRLMAAAPGYLVDGGWLLIEIAATQAAAATAWARAAGLREVAVRADYAGLPRVLLARR